MGGNIESSNFGLNVNMIGESLYFLNLYLTKSIYTKTKSTDKKIKKSIIDFWNFNYELNSSIQNQIDKVFQIYEDNKKYAEINSKEALIVHIKNKDSDIINKIFSKLEKIKRSHYMPLVLFLLDEYSEDENNNKIIPNKDFFPNINPNIIYTAEFINNKEYLFESEQKEITKEGEKKMDKIINILLRFCSYHNDLGDRFTVGEGNNAVNYDLTEKYFPFTLNICCIGRFGKGKSTCVNCLLGEMKAKESKSGTSTTKKINYYQIKDQPIKIYDIPGFENQETTLNAVQKLKELNDEINELKDQLHFILYIIKSTDERMFADLEFDMINEISKQKNSKLLYILTHSSKNTDIDEIIDMINIGIKNIINKKIIDNYYEIYLKMRAYKDNCIFVNFHEERNKPIYGIGELFNKLSVLAKYTDIYKKYTKKSMSDSRFKELINEEADIRKKKAEKILFYHSIGAGVIGVIPGLDLAIQKFVIQKNATKKIGQVFGLDINLIEKENSLDLSKANNDNNFTIENKSKTNKTEIFSRAGQFSISGAQIGVNLARIPNEAGKMASISGEIIGASLRAVSIAFFFIGSGIGIGTGYYFTYKHCKELIDKLYKYFKDNAETLSTSFQQAVQYLELQAKNHLEKTQ